MWEWKWASCAIGQRGRARKRLWCSSAFRVCVFFTCKMSLLYASLWNCKLSICWHMTHVLRMLIEKQTVYSKWTWVSFIIFVSPVNSRSNTLELQHLKVVSFTTLESGFFYFFFFQSDRRWYWFKDSQAIASSNDQQFSWKTSHKNVRTKTAVSRLRDIKAVAIDATAVFRKKKRKYQDTFFSSW